MSLWSSIRGLFGSQSLRNKAGGMAFVRGLTDFHELNGRIVKTVRVREQTQWEIDPPQRVRNMRAGIVFTSGEVSRGGERGSVTGIADDCLVPLGDPGITTEEVKELFSPSPAKESEKV